MYYSSEYLSFCKGIVHQSVSFNFLPIVIDYIISSYLCSPYEPKERHGFVSHNTIVDIIQSEMMSSAEVFNFWHPIMICMKKLLVFQTPISKIVLLYLVNPTWFCFTWLCSWLLLFIKVCRNHMLLMKIYNYPNLIWVTCVCRFIPQNSTLLKFTAASI